MDFIQPTGWATNLNELPSVAMEFNGTIIENEIEGYRTLKVSGRETISNELVVESVHEGGITLDSHLPSRHQVVLRRFRQYRLGEAVSR